MTLKGPSNAATNDLNHDNAVGERNTTERDPNVHGVLLCVLFP